MAIDLKLTITLDVSKPVLDFLKSLVDAKIQSVTDKLKVSSNELQKAVDAAKP